jgi:hypothetical protein
MSGPAHKPSACRSPPSPVTITLEKPAAASRSVISLLFANCRSKKLRTTVARYFLPWCTGSLLAFIALIGLVVSEPIHGAFTVSEAVFAGAGPTGDFSGSGVGILHLATCACAGDPLSRDYTNRGRRDEHERQVENSPMSDLGPQDHFDCSVEMGWWDASWSNGMVGCFFEQRKNDLVQKVIVDTDERIADVSLCIDNVA